MAGVYCPTCESSVEAAAKFCLSCGHDLTVQGPITSTGHDLNQIKDVIRHREDLSMAEKFDMIARVEEGANPITMGIAAAADDGENFDIGQAFEGAGDDISSFKKHEFGQSPAANAAVRAVVRGTSGWDMIKAGTLDMSDGMFRDAMNHGMDASTHIHDVASGEHEGIDPEAMRAIPVLKPPKRSFCPKCGSDIHNNTMLQWRKWRESSSDVVSMQMEAAMETALIEVASHYVNVIQALKDERDDAVARAAKASAEGNEDSLREKLESEIRAELEKEFKSEGKSKSSGKSQSKSKSQPKKTQSKPKSKPKTGGLFGAKRPKKTYEGEPGGKADWFLEEALDTVYDPHGTGKSVKGATILARSSDGNVRVRDVVRAYALQGRDGVLELAWTNPITEYLIEAFDAC
ncbi:MAG TPA: zinc ribbon domain-containing protein [Candidatus Poseidoniales archaeon]|nr:MAG TPA: zinc ribbon domain-containing protein [Candidatus Poseidoniales archaeon]HII32774.1 zinc ribbon domain-containing protein [Candidatus Poseidoniaceae archaeon]|tara:strand:+ start:455 stop:1666 length:1212 start_codon:yes stop_codon:yes gene_type:complete